MPTEARRGFQRIVANYMRLVSWLALGIVLLPMLIGWVGLEAYGLISLIGASLGFAAIFQQVTSLGMIRELGAAYHDADPERFPQVYSSAFVVSSGMAALALVVFAVLWTFIELLEIPPDLVGPARWIVAGQGAYAVLFTLVAPTFVMYRVQERFGWYAFWMIAIRACALAAAIILAWGFGVSDVPAAVTLYGILWSGLLCVVLMAAVLTLTLTDRRLRPAARLVRRQAVGAVFHTFGWNTASYLSISMSDRLAAVLMNLVFGLFGNAVFQVGLQLTSYVRMMTTGVTFGLEAVSARVSSGEVGRDVTELCRHSTRLQAFVSLPAGLAIFLLADPVLRLWIGRALADPQRTIPAAVLIVQILMLAVTSRAIADGWIMILYGAGHVRRYAPLLVVGGLLAPVLGLVLVLVLPDPLRFNAPAIGYSVVLTLAQFVALPMAAARCLGVRLPALYAPLARPALVTAACAPILILPDRLLGQWTPPTLLGACSLFAAAYGLLGWRFVLDAAERRRFTLAARRRLPGVARRAAPREDP